MAKKETAGQNKFRVKSSRIKSKLIQCVRLFRNNVGMFTTANGDIIRTGLCKGSSDLIGWTSMKVTKDMVGTDVAIFTAVEWKKGPKDKPKPHQQNFIETVNDAGGIAFHHHDPDEACDILKGAFNKIKK